MTTRSGRHYRSTPPPSRAESKNIDPVTDEGYILFSKETSYHAETQGSKDPTQHQAPQMTPNIVNSKALNKTPLTEEQRKLIQLKKEEAQRKRILFLQSQLEKSQVIACRQEYSPSSTSIHQVTPNPKAKKVLTEEQRKQIEANRQRALELQRRALSLSPFSHALS